jgi:hypothetical protein
VEFPCSYPIKCLCATATWCVMPEYTLVDGFYQKTWDKAFWYFMHIDQPQPPAAPDIYPPGNCWIADSVQHRDGTSYSLLVWARTPSRMYNPARQVKDFLPFNWTHHVRIEWIGRGYPFWIWSPVTVLFLGDGHSEWRTWVDWANYFHWDRIPDYPEKQFYGRGRPYYPGL